MRATYLIDAASILNYASANNTYDQYFITQDHIQSKRVESILCTRS